MKKIKFIFALFLALFLMTGCVKYNASMEIKADKSMDFKIVYAMDMSTLNALGDDSTSTTESNEMLTAEQKAEFEKLGYQVKEYNEGNYKGVELTYSVKNIDDVSKTEDFELKLADMLNENSEKNSFFIVKKGFLKNTYKAVYKFDANSGSDSSMDMSAYLKNMDLKFDVKLPNGANSNNATKAEDGNKSLSWDLTQKTLSEINFEFDIWNTTNILIVAGAAIAAIAVIVVIVVAIVLSSKKKKA